MTTPWLTSQEAANYIKVAPRVLNKYCRRGKLRFARLGGKNGTYRFNVEWLDAFVTMGGK